MMMNPLKGSFLFVIPPFGSRWKAASAATRDIAATLLGLWCAREGGGGRNAFSLSSLQIALFLLGSALASITQCAPDSVAVFSFGERGLAGCLGLSL
jgi:hypothetical protein